MRAPAIGPASIGAVLLLISGVDAQQVPASSAGTWTVQEETIGELDAATPEKDTDVRAAPDMQRIAWREARGKQWTWVVNGKQVGGVYDEVTAMTFSPLGEHTAYTGRRLKSWFAVIDGAEGPAYEQVDGLVFSLDGRRYGYRGTKQKSHVVIIDGKEEPAADGASSPVFSADGARAAYAACRSKRCVLRVDGQEQGPDAETMFAPFLSADGQHLAIRATRGKKYFYVVDGKEVGRDLDWVDAGLFTSTNGFSFRGRRKTASFYVIDGQEGPTFDVLGGLALTRDGKRHAYAGARFKFGFFNRYVGSVVVDAKEGPAFEGDRHEQPVADPGDGRVWVFDPYEFGVSDPSFSPDGTRLAHAGRRGADDTVMFVNDEAGTKFSSIVNGPFFSVDGAHLGYIGVLENPKRLAEVRDGRVLAQFAMAKGLNFVTQTTFSPDGLRLAYVMGIGKVRFGMGMTNRARRSVVVDGREGKEYDVPAIVVSFSADSRHLAAIVHDLKPGKYLAVLDGQEGALYDDMATWVWRFNNDNKLVYFARAGRKMLRVTHSFN